MEIKHTNIYGTQIVIIGSWHSNTAINMNNDKDKNNKLN